jgi:hypothetical protein
VRIRDGVRSRRAAALTGAVALVAGGLTVVAAPGASASDWSRCVHGSSNRQAVFARAARVSGVPAKVLLGVSYLESRWDDHGAHPSTSGGYGPMHLTAVDLDTQRNSAAKGEASTQQPKQAGTLVKAAALTGLPASALRADDVANICGGAALLASYQPDTTAQGPSAWSAAVARYSGAADQAGALRFASQVFTVIRNGASRTTNDGQRVALAPTPGAAVDTAAVKSLALAQPSATTVDCPPVLACESLPAPYEKYGPNPGDYGNYDLAHRPSDLKINYIVIHDTEGSYAGSVKLVQDPTYLGWHYTIRSSDGHVAEHVPNQDVGWHAGNWYVNMHSIGIEHEGYAARGATWYTEAMYENSATLVRYLAAKYGVPLDRAHIIGHDQVPGTVPSTVRGMHWDPGPYWDWEHYMDLLDAPLHADPRGPSDVVTVVPDFANNPQPVTGCDSTQPDAPCPTQGTNFVYLHTQPSEDSPLVQDIGLHPNGADSTTGVSDIGPRVAAGQKLVVAKRSGDWLGVWYLGEIGWMKRDNAAGESVVRPSQGTVVEPTGDQAVPVYGRAYPEAAAYPSTIPVQSVTPLQYTIKPGQAYVLADPDIQTDYYYAKTYNCAYVADDCTDVVGKDRYYEIWFGHRIAYVRAADVRIADGTASALQP